MSIIETRYRSLIENLHDGFILVNHSLQIMQINGAFVQMIGYEYDKIIGNNLLNFVAHPSDQIALLEGIRRRMAHQIDSYDLNFRTKNGKLVFTNISPTPYLDSNGQVTGSFAIVKDLTELKRKDNTLHYQAHILAHISEGIIVTNKNGNIKYWNPTAEKILGYNLSLAYNKNVFELFPLEKDFYTRRLNDKPQSEKGIQQEIEFVTSTGIKKNLRLSTAMLKNIFNEFTGTVTVVSDFTELIRSRQEAENANQAKTNFLANISHDLRTPLIGIIGASDLLSQEKLSDYQDNLITTIVKSGKQLLELINDILDLSKIEAGYSLGTAEEFKLDELINECIEAISAKKDINNISFIVDIAPDIPPFLMGEPVQIKRVIMNLIDNAVKYTSAGYIKLTAHSLHNHSLKPGENYIFINIEDTGSGIPSHELSSIFEAFHQIDHTVSQGTGLGLAICKQLVENMGGKIWVSSLVGQGTKFTFYLPLKKSISSPPKTSSLPGIDYATQVVTGKSILLVEDNETNSKIIFYMLKKAGYTVTIAHNGQECLDLLQNTTFDLILMDMQMPVLDGYETTKFIRMNEAWNNIPIIALTAFAMPDTAEKCIRLGCNYFLSKPVSARELVNTIDTFLNHEEKEQLNPSDQEIVKTLIPEFLYTTKLLLKKLQLAVDSNNLKSAAAIGHDLKGMCGMYGFTDLLDVATLVYTDALNGDSEGLQTSIKKLNHRLLIELKKVST